MLLKITSKGESYVIDKEPLESLGKHEKHLEKWMSKNLERLIDGIQLWTIHEERPAQSEADIIALDDAGNTFIFELKRGEAGHRAVGQLFNYWTAIAEMKYDKLQERARRHYKNENLDLAYEHFNFFNLKKAIDKEKFNKESRLLVVAEKANENLWNMIAFLRSRFSVPLGFVKYEIYRLKKGKNEELVLHFDTSDANELLNEITGEEEAVVEELYEDKKRYFWYNTNKEHLDPPESHDKVFDMDVAATYGPKIFGEKLASSAKGDHIFAYANGEGIRAYGIVTGKWSGEPVGSEEKAVTKDRREYHLPMRWEIVLKQDDAIRPDEIRALGYSNFRGTFRRIRNPEFAKKLVAIMKSKRE